MEQRLRHEGATDYGLVGIKSLVDAAICGVVVGFVLYVWLAPHVFLEWMLSYYPRTPPRLIFDLWKFGCVGIPFLGGLAAVNLIVLIRQCGWQEPRVTKEAA